MERTILTVAFYTISIISMTKQQLYLGAFVLLKVLGEQSGPTDSQVGLMDFSCGGEKGADNCLFCQRISLCTRWCLCSCPSLLISENEVFISGKVSNVLSVKAVAPGYLKASVALAVYSSRILQRPLPGSSAHEFIMVGLASILKSLSKDWCPLVQKEQEAG